MARYTSHIALINLIQLFYRKNKELAFDCFELNLVRLFTHKNNTSTYSN